MDSPVFTKIEENEWMRMINVNLVGNHTNRALSLIADELKLQLERIEEVRM